MIIALSYGLNLKFSMQQASGDDMGRFRYAADQDFFFPTQSREADVHVNTLDFSPPTIYSGFYTFLPSDPDSATCQRNLLP